jgi:hypothetical protein
VYLLAAVALPLVGSPERMEEAIYPLMITVALLATRTWSQALVWLFAVCGVLFAARVGGDARVPAVLAWTGLIVACALALGSYVPSWLAGWRRLSERPRLRPGAPPGTTVRSR